MSADMSSEAKTVPLLLTFSQRFGVATKLIQCYILAEVRDENGDYCTVFPVSDLERCKAVIKRSPHDTELGEIHRALPSELECAFVDTIGHLSPTGSEEDYDAVSSKTYLYEFTYIEHEESYSARKDQSTCSLEWLCFELNEGLKIRIDSEPNGQSGELVSGHISWRGDPARGSSGGDSGPKEVPDEHRHQIVTRLDFDLVLPTNDQLEDILSEEADPA